MRTREHNERISKSMRAFFATESPEHREARINKLQERKAIEKALYEKYLELLQLNEIFDITKE